MKIPFLTEANVDMILRALGAGGYLPNNTDRNAIRTVDPNLSETARDNLAASFTYGGGGGGGSDRLTSPTDCWVLLDNDNSDSPTPYTNYFSVIKGQTSTPASSAAHWVMTVGSQSSPDGSVICSLGPRLDQVTAADNRPATLTLGAGGDTFNSFVFGSFVGNIYGLQISTSIYQGAGLSLYTRNHIWNYADQSVTFGVWGGMFPIIRGGFADLSTTSKFGVGADLYANPSAHALAIEKPADNTLRIYATDTTAERQIYFMGGYGPSATDKRVQVAVGGVPAQAGQDPRAAYQSIGGGYTNPGPVSAGVVLPHDVTFLVVSPDRGVATKSCAFRVWHRTDNVPADTHLVNFHSNIDMQTADEHIRLLSVTGFWGTERCIAFEVRADRTAYAAAFSTTGLDVAEAFTSAGEKSSYPAGTVMVMLPDGGVTSATGYADPKVVGVISTAPGMKLGGSELGGDRTHLVHLGMAGTVPVRVTTDHGQILQGDLLVSASEGMAAKAPDQVVAGTVLGKALGDLLQPGSAVVTGTVRMLILLR